MGMGFTWCWLLLGCAGGWAQARVEVRTVVSPLPGEDILRPCEYQMVLPDTAQRVKAVWAIFDRGQDYLKWFQDRQVRAFATEHGVALMLAMQCRSKGREDMNVDPAAGVGRAMFTALDQFAESEGRPELKMAGVIAMGWSGAGSLVARLAGYRTERYLAGIAYAPGQYEPLGMNTIELPAGAIGKPQLTLANGGDNINGTERPYGYFRKYFDRGAQWTFVVQNRTPHCCLQNAQALILNWVDAVLGKREGLRYGYFTAVHSEVVDDWKRPVFNVRNSRTGTGRKARRGDLPAGWMPSADFEREWLGFTRREKPIAIWKP